MNLRPLDPQLSARCPPVFVDVRVRAGSNGFHYTGGHRWTPPNLGEILDPLRYPLRYHRPALRYHQPDHLLLEHADRHHRIASIYDPGGNLIQLGGSRDHPTRKDPRMSESFNPYANRGMSPAEAELRCWFLHDQAELWISKLMQGSGPKTITRAR